MSNDIDLGVKSSELYAKDGPMGMTMGPDNKEVVYPCFHYSGPKELDLPDHGDMNIHFRKKSETSKVLEDGSHWYECCIQVRKICDVEGEEVSAPTHRDTSTEDALDALAKAVTKRMGDDGEEGEDY